MEEPIVKQQTFEEAAIKVANFWAEQLKPIAHTRFDPVVTPDQYALFKKTLVEILIKQHDPLENRYTTLLSVDYNACSELETAAIKAGISTVLFPYKTNTWIMGADYQVKVRRGYGADIVVL